MGGCGCCMIVCVCGGGGVGVCVQCICLFFSAISDQYVLAILLNKYERYLSDNVHYLRLHTMKLVTFFNNMCNVAEPSMLSAGGTGSSIIYVSCLNYLCAAYFVG